MNEKFRWLATVTYRTDSGPTEVDHAFGELFDLHDLIEDGPSWYSIEKIEIRFQPMHDVPTVTIEESEKQ